MRRGSIAAPRSSLLAGIALLLVACGGSSTPSSAKASGPIPVGILYGFTGRTAFYGQYVDNGVRTAIQEINNSGGVLGEPLTLYTADTASDVADAVPAFRELMTHNPDFILGTSSIEAGAIHPLVDEVGIPDFSFATATQYDNLFHKWTYVGQPSDPQQGTAMAYYAIKKGWTKCAILIENDASDQSLVSPLMQAYTSHGGTITANISLVPDQSSYLTQVETAFASSPQCVFAAEDQQTAGTLFSNARELGHLNVPYIGSNIFADPTFVPAVGASAMSTLVTSMGTAAPSGPAFDYFSKEYSGLFHGNTPNAVEAIAYDDTVIAALAITKAGTTDRSTWVKDITDVSNPPGTAVTNYAQGVQLLKQGRKINYEGASGPMDFTANHGVISSWVVQLFASDGKTFRTIYTIPALALEAF
jgi:ABC-type branched-subunit amino acid transport system substrate-binding protein